MALRGVYAEGEGGMRDNIENESGLERLGRNLVMLVVAGALAVVGVAGWGLYALWKGLT